MGNRNSVDINVLVKGAQTAAGEISKVGAALKASIATLAGGVVGTFVTRGFIRAYEESTQAAVAVAQLQRALISTGQASRTTEQALVDQADALQRLTGVSDEAVLDAQRLLLTFGATASEVQKLTPLIADLAANLGTDLTSAARLVGSALDGESVSLGKLNITAKTVDELIRQLTRSVGGQAEAIKAARGPTVDIGTAFSQLTENIGDFIRPEVDFVLGGIAKAAYAAAAAVKNLSATMGNARDAVGYYSIAANQAYLHLKLMAGLVSQSEFVENMAALQQTQSNILNSTGAYSKEPPKNAPAVGSPDGVPYIPFRIEPPSLPFYAARQNTLDVSLRGVDLEFQRKEGAFGARASARRQELLEKELKILDVKQRVLLDTENLINLDDFRAQQLDIETKRLEIQNRLTKEKSDELERQKQLALELSIPANLSNSLDQLIEKVGSVAQQVGRTFTSIAESSIDAISQGIDGLLQGTLSWGQALNKIRSGILSGITQAISRMFAEWIVGRTAVFLKEIFFSAQETAAKAPSALLTSITSYGTAALVGAAALTAALAAFGGFSGGGYTGAGGKYEPAGTVHRGEVVFSQADVAGLGLANIEAYRRSYRSSYASGGTVGLPQLSSPAVNVAPAGVTVVMVNSAGELKRLLESRQGQMAIVNASNGARIDMGVNT